MRLQAIFFGRDVCRRIVDLFKTQRACAFDLLFFQLGTFHNQRTNHLSPMLTAVLCGLKWPFEVRDEHQLLQSAHLHINLLHFLRPAADALDMPSV